MKHTISILVENRPGVLARIAAMFSARDYNIDSLSVAETTDSTVSRITCTAVGDDLEIEQIMKQLRKLIDVIRVVNFTTSNGDFITREMVLIKVNARARERAEIMRTADIFRAKIVDASRENLTLEVTGDEKKIDAILELLMPFGILEIARTGQVALSRGAKRLMDRHPESKKSRRSRIWTTRSAGENPGKGIGNRWMGDRRKDRS
ncbi:MAG: acetolactate synthase small subunit [Proteobacteria bacterium]|nr:acetolactate synthase small subunit [Pseudomonadota bacterium]